MAQIDGQIHLVMLRDVVNVLFVLHIHRYELITDFRGVLSVVHKAKLLGFDILLQFRIVIKSNTFRLYLLSPTVLIKALSKEDNIRQYDLVVVLVDSVAHAIEIQCKDLIYEHLGSV